MLIRAVNNERNSYGAIQVRHTINYLPISKVARPPASPARVDYVGNCSATNQLEGEANIYDPLGHTPDVAVPLCAPFN